MAICQYFFSTDIDSVSLRQGCTISPLLFLLIAEVMDIKIRAAKNIAGMNFQINNIKTETLKMLQYCDDTTLILSNQADLEEALRIIDSFFCLSGLKLNKEKSIAMWIGSSKDNTNQPCNLLWKKKGELIKILGVFFSAIKEASDIEENWVNKIKQINEIACRLLRRKTTIWGKVLLCKTFMISQISYLLQSLALPEKVLNEIDSICFKFIWNKNSKNKRIIEKIKRSVMCIEKDQGGASMIKSASQQKLFLAKWIMKIGKTEQSKVFKLTKLPDIYFNFYGNHDIFTKFLCKQTDLEYPSYISRFWRDAINSWLVLKHNFKIIHEAEPEVIKDYCNIQHDKIPIFFNKDLTYKNKIIFFPRWIKAGIHTLDQITNENGNILLTTNIDDSIKKRPDFMFDFGVVNTAFTNHKRNNSNFSMLELNVNKILRAKNSLLRYIIDYSLPRELCGKQFWERKYTNTDIKGKYLSSIKSIKETKLQVTLFKIFHNILPSGVLRKKMKLTESDKCVCGETDFIEHRLVHCQLLQPL